MLSPKQRIDDIQRVTCQVYGIDPRRMLGADRCRRMARPRQIAMALARELTGLSYPIIGRRFGGRDHTTVLHACRRIAALLRDDDSLRVEINAIRFALGVSLHERAILAAALSGIGQFCAALGETLYARDTQAAA